MYRMVWDLTITISFIWKWSRTVVWRLAALAEGITSGLWPACSIVSIFNSSDTPAHQTTCAVNRIDRECLCQSSFNPWVVLEQGRCDVTFPGSAHGSYPDIVPCNQHWTDWKPWWMHTSYSQGIVSDWDLSSCKWRTEGDITDRTQDEIYPLIHRPRIVKLMSTNTLVDQRYWW